MQAAVSFHNMRHPGREGRSPDQRLPGPSDRQGEVSSTVDLPGFAARWTGFDREVLMPIRITCPNKCLNGRQVIESTGLMAPSAADPKVSYTGTKTQFRILCGSI